MRTRRRLAALAASALLVLAGCAGQPTGGDEPSSSGAAPSSGPAAEAPKQAEPTVTVEVYGDSLTVADSPDLRAGRTGRQSWVHHVDDHGVAVVGAAGRWGATADEVLQLHLRTGEDAVQAQWLLAFLGTNDAGRAGSPDSGGFTEAHEAYVEQIGSIAERTGYPEERVVVVGVGPINAEVAERTQAWNELTAQAAQERGWQLVDPWERLRGPDGRYADPDHTTDGLHLSESGAQLLAEGIAEDLHEVSRSAP